MNERIVDDLVLKARASAITDTKDGGKQFNLEVFHRKFAELIVRECVDIAVKQKQWVENQEVFNPNDEQWNRARIQQSQHIADRIRLHFGVEQ